jgi:ribosomal protein S18 acetylase RimI-like enzyme
LLTIRLATAADRAAAYYVALKTGDSGQDAETLFSDDPDALGRIFVGPYLAFEPDLALVLEDDGGVCGYALGAFDSRTFYARYESEWRPELAERFPAPAGDAEAWTATERIYRDYHAPDYYCPEPYGDYPSHLHIDLLPRAQGRGYGRRMIERLTAALRERGSPGVHLGASVRNERAIGFYRRLGFVELSRVGADRDGTVYMGRRL